MTQYSLVPTKTLRKLEKLADLLLSNNVSAKVELIGKKAAQNRFGLSDGQWNHLIRTGPENIVKRQGQGSKNCAVKIDAAAYARQYL